MIFYKNTFVTNNKDLKVSLIPLTNKAYSLNNKYTLIQ